MATAMITQRGTIKARHAVREEFSGCSSCGGPHTYYDSKGAALRAFNSALEGYDLCFDVDDWLHCPCDEGRMTIAVHIRLDDQEDSDDKGACVGYALLTWYRLPNGRYEFIGYLT
jgi:hypothetical protein